MDIATNYSSSLPTGHKSQHEKGGLGDAVFDLDALIGKEAGQPSSGSAAEEEQGSSLSAQAAEMFRQVTGYSMINSADGVSFVDAGGKPAPADKLAMLKAASGAFSTAGSNGHPLHQGIDLHTDNVETVLSQVGVKSSNIDMYKDLMTIFDNRLADHV